MSLIIRNPSLIQISGYLLILTGVLHILVFVLSGFTYGGMGLSPVGVLFLLLGFGLLQNRRWLAWLVYLGVGIGVSYAIRGVFVPSVVPSWYFGLIVLVDIAAIVTLFVALWRPATKPA